MTEPRPYRGIQRFGDNKDMWAFGSLLILGLRHYIVPIPPKHETPADDITLLAQVCERVEVAEESVGQSTGLKDKNGMEIYEGDILQYTWYEDKGQYGITHNKQMEIKFMDASFSVSRLANDPYQFRSKDWEVIGNIHQNPDLLKGDK